MGSLISILICIRIISLLFSLLHLKGSHSLTAAANLRALCFPCSDNLLLCATFVYRFQVFVLWVRTYFFVGEWLPEGPIVLHPSRRALSFNLSLYYVNIKLLLSLGLSPHLLSNFLIHFVLTRICQCSRLLSQKLGCGEVSFGRSSRISLWHSDLVDQGDSGLSKWWMPWSARLSHSDRMVSWIQGTGWVSRYVW